MKRVGNDSGRLFGNSEQPEHSFPPYLDYPRGPKTETRHEDMEEKHSNLSQDTATCDNMENKELNLCEILKGHEEKFYSPIYGEVIVDFDEESQLRMWPLAKDAYLPIAPNGHHIEHQSEGYCILWPTKEAYLKYPLDARAAWQEWVEANKPKRWRAKTDDVEKYYFISTLIEVGSDIDMRVLFDNKRYENGNYFRTEDLAKQAVEAVKATLEQFHKTHQQ